jgi:2-oxoglutarate ferredoxin oxidoreductase subunit beta
VEQSFDVIDLVRAAGAPFVARSTVMHAHLLDKLLVKGLTNPGFNLIEVMTPCHTQYGRKNNFKTVVDMYKWYRKQAIPLEKYNDLPPEKRAGRIPIGIFQDKQTPGLEERYAAMRETLREARGE